MMTTAIAAALLLLALGLFYGSVLLPEAPDPNDVGAGGFPRLVAIVMMVFAVPLIVQTLRAPEENRAAGRTRPRTLLFMLLTFVHAAAIPFIGYYAAVSVWLAATLLLLGSRLGALLLPIGFVSFVWLLFGRVFGVPLP
jgi:hypothetical protein